MRFAGLGASGRGLGPALEGIDRVFLATGYSVDMLRQSKEFLDAARKAGVRHVVHLGACGPKPSCRTCCTTTAPGPRTGA